MIDNEKLGRHIEHLQQAHDDLDKKIINEYVKYGNDAVVQDMKKRKLHLKDEIEVCRNKLNEG